MAGIEELLHAAATERDALREENAAQAHEIERLRSLVRSAFGEGWFDGRGESRDLSVEQRAWDDSGSKRQIDAVAEERDAAEAKLAEKDRIIESLHAALQRKSEQLDSSTRAIERMTRVMGGAGDIEGDPAA